MPKRHPTIHVKTVTVIDPDTSEPVELEIRKDLTTGAIVGLDGSFLEQMDADPRDPYNAGQSLIVPDSEFRDPILMKFQDVGIGIYFNFVGGCQCQEFCKTGDLTYRDVREEADGRGREKIIRDPMTAVWIDAGIRGVSGVDAATTPKPPETVWIIWGEQYSGEYDRWMESGHLAAAKVIFHEHASKYTFGTLAEMNAFLKGVSEGHGCNDWTQIDTPPGDPNSLSEHDVVRVIEDVESDGYAVKKGMTGAIVSVYNSGEAYAVELSEIEDGPAVVTLQAGEVELVPRPATSPLCDECGEAFPDTAGSIEGPCHKD